jgi:acyl carrier protein
MKKLKHILSSTLGVDAKVITDSSSTDTLTAWDSFTSLMLMSELENEYNVKFTMSEVREINSVQNIILLLSKHGVIITSD